MLTALLLHLPALAQGTAAPTADPWRVVLVRSWDSLYRANVARENSIREAILENAPRIVEFYPEEIDPLRFPAAMEADFVALLKRKYRDTPIDLVVVSGIEPLQFAVRYRDAIWPAAGIVFAGVFEGSLDGWKLPPRTTGVLLGLDVEGTLEVGRALQPGASRLYVVSGSAQFDIYYRELVMRKLRALQAPIEVHPIVGLSRAETAARVSALEPGALVLYLTMLRDASGQLSGPATPALEEISRRSSVPVVTVAHSQLGYGPTAASAPPQDQHGRAAGQLARKVLEGLDPETVPVAAFPPPVCVVDWRGVERYRIVARHIPKHCSVINEPPQLWRLYFWPLVALLAVIVAQSALIFSMMMQSRKRRAEAELEAKRAEMAQVSRLSMIGALTASIAHEINQPMGAILGNAEAAEIMLEKGTLDSEKLREILADIRKEDLRASDVIKGLRNLLGRNEGRLAALDINTEVAEALRHVSFEAARRGARLTPLFANRLPTVMGDAVQLQQVVINLVMNAMQAVTSMPESSREIRIETRAAGSGLEISVSDWGPGVAPEDLERLFQSTFMARRDGMSFGLAIVRSIVENHRGRVTHRPNVPRGAVFTVWMPAIGP